jgi:tRNA(fMet)-specific endonuclease VapC
MSLMMLDTNIVSHIIRGDCPEILARLTSVSMEDLVISAVTEGELRYGLAKRGHPQNLSERVRQFLLRVDVLPWDRDAALSYGELRASCEEVGVSLSPLDTMIAAHARAGDHILITRDKAFARIPAPFRLQDWSAN